MSEDLAKETSEKKDQAVKVCIENGFANWMSRGAKPQVCLIGNKSK